MNQDKVAEYIGRVRAIAPIIREHADESDANSQLSPAIAEAFHQRSLFRVLLPARMGGGDLTLQEQFAVAEEVASVDGATGWNFAICSSGPIFGGYVKKATFEKVFADPRSVIAGSLNAMTSRALPCEGGYRFTGKATNASGSGQANWLMAGGIVMRDGGPRIVNGLPEMRAGLFPMSEARIQNTWLVSGMRGTGSNDCAFEDIFVPEEFTFAWPEPPPAWDAGPHARIPLLVLLGGALAAVGLGVARHAIESFAETAAFKVPAGPNRSLLRDRPQAQIQIAQAEGLLRAGRAYLHQSSREIWEKGKSGQSFDLATRASARLAMVTAAKFAAQAVDLICDVAGMDAVLKSRSLERCWRDVHTVTQHIAVNSARYEAIGRVVLGVDPGGFV